MAPQLKKCARRHAKTYKMELNITRIQFLRKVGFGNSFHSKTLFREPPASRFRRKNGCEKRPGKYEPGKTHNMFALGAQNTFRIEIPNPQSITNSTSDTHMSFLLLPQSPRVPPKYQSNSPECQNSGTWFRKSHFWESKKTTVLCFGNKNCVET